MSDSKLSDVSVGDEMGGNPAAYFMRRTFGAAEILMIPEVEEMIDEAVRHVDRVAAVEEFPVKDLEIRILPAPNRRWIPIVLGARECYTCSGSGYTPNGDSFCPMCKGKGYR